MFDKKYGHVGRPTNEEVNNRKNKKKIIIILILILVFAIPMIAYMCINDEEFDLSSIMGNSSVVSQFNIYISGKKVKMLNLPYNSKKQLTVDSDISKLGVTWKSSNDQIVVVNKGNITTKSGKVGRAIITAETKNGKKSEVIVNVYPTGDYTPDLKNVPNTLEYNKNYFNYKTNIKLKRHSAIMQSFAISDEKLYISQQQGNNAGAYISRMGLYGVKNIEGDKGQYLGNSYAILKNYGHVNNIDIEITNGKRYLWTGCEVQGSTEKHHCRVKISDIEFSNKKQVQRPDVKIFTGTTSVSVDPHNRIIVTMSGSRANPKFKVYNLDEYIEKKGIDISSDIAEKDVVNHLKKANGKQLDPMFSFSKKHKINKYSRQGFDVDGNYIYVYEGNSSSKDVNGVFISVYKLDGTEVIYRKKVAYPTSDYYWEPEGIKVYNDHLYIGFSRINKTSRKRNQFIFRVTNDKNNIKTTE